MIGEENTRQFYLEWIMPSLKKRFKRLLDFDAAIDIDILIAVLLFLVIFVTLEALIMTRGLAQAAQAAAAVKRPDQLLFYFQRLIVELIPLVGVNVLLGVAVAYRVSVPLRRIRLAVQAVSRGDLEHEVLFKDGPFFESYLQDCHDMLQTLRRLLYRDSESAKIAQGIISDCQRLISEQQLAAPERKKIDELLIAARSQLSMVNDHFLKGKKETL